MEASSIGGLLGWQDFFRSRAVLRYSAGCCDEDEPKFRTSSACRRGMRSITLESVRIQSVCRAERGYRRRRFAISRRGRGSARQGSIVILYTTMTTFNDDGLYKEQVVVPNLLNRRRQDAFDKLAEIGLLLSFDKTQCTGANRHAVCGRRNARRSGYDDLCHIPDTRIPSESPDASTDARPRRRRLPEEP